MPRRNPRLDESNEAGERVDCRSLQIPRSSGLMRPSAVTAAASVKTRPAPRRRGCPGARNASRWRSRRRSSTDTSAKRRRDWGREIAKTDRIEKVRHGLHCAKTRREGAEGQEGTAEKAKGLVPLHRMRRFLGFAVVLSATLAAQSRPVPCGRPIAERARPPPKRRLNPRSRKRRPTPRPRSADRSPAAEAPPGQVRLTALSRRRPERLRPRADRPCRMARRRPRGGADARDST